MLMLKITYTNNGKTGTVTVPADRYHLIQCVVLNFGEKIIQVESFDSIDELDKPKRP